MSVIVKGMEMPSGCQSCDFSDDETRFCKAAKEYIPMLGKPEFCPLVELPEKHGRLIDADALEKDGYTLAIMRIDRHEDGTLTNWCELIPLEDAPTIVEAEV